LAAAFGDGHATPKPGLRNGNGYFRLHIPSDDAEKAKGTRVAIPVGDAIRYQLDA
jgi:hypothetical protein